MCWTNVETATNFPNRFSGAVDKTWREAGDVGQTVRKCWFFIAQKMDETGRRY